MPPLAYHLTFRTYGTWLPGDPRGYNDRGSPRASPNPALHAFCEGAMPAPSLLLNARARAVIDSAIRAHCAHAGWTLHAVHVRTNHVHVVVRGTAPPERIMGQLKSWATRRLREAGLVGGTTRPWAQHGSTRYLWTEGELEDACTYVVDGQGAALEMG
jgi:REP element-mobilizing transposase RayT